LYPGPVCDVTRLTHLVTSQFTWSRHSSPGHVTVHLVTSQCDVTRCVSLVLSQPAGRQWHVLTHVLVALRMLRSCSSCSSSFCSSCSSFCPNNDSDYCSSHTKRQEIFATNSGITKVSRALVLPGLGGTLQTLDGCALFIALP